MGGRHQCHSVDQGHLTVIAAALLCMIAVMVIAKKWKSPPKGMIRIQACIAFVLAAVLTVNNVFGWASTNPIYGGTGSGTVDTTTAVGILVGLENAGFETNSELSELYAEYRADRPVISINEGQEWTLPEIPAKEYPKDVLEHAQAYSDTAIIVISRTGGEGTDLPQDMGSIMDGSTMEMGTKYLNGSYINSSKEYDDFEAGQSYLELSRTKKDMVDMV